MPLHIATPLLESRPLSRHTGSAVWLKMEALQPSGSFKLRGIGHACETQVRQGCTRLVASSGGNAGLAVAYAGRHLGVPVTVFLPETTSARARELIELESAHVRVHGASWDEAHALARASLSAGDALIHPFDDPLLWRGHATMIDEVAEARLKPDLVILAVGGGGLLCGVLEGMHRHRWHNVPVWAVETEGAASYAAALAAGKVVQLERITSVATTLGARAVCQQALAWSKRHPIESVLVSDAAAMDAAYQFLRDHRVLTETACGAALAAAYAASAQLKEYNTVLLIVCGGAGVSLPGQQTAPPHAL